MGSNVVRIIACVLGIFEDETHLLRDGVAPDSPQELGALAREHGTEDELNVALFTTCHLCVWVNRK